MKPTKIYKVNWQMFEKDWKGIIPIIAHLLKMMDIRLNEEVFQREIPNKYKDYFILEP